MNENYFFLNKSLSCKKIIFIFWRNNISSNLSILAKNKMLSICWLWLFYALAILAFYGCYLFFIPGRDGRGDNNISSFDR